jgi:hypothetical protein
MKTPSRFAASAYVLTLLAPLAVSCSGGGDSGGGPVLGTDNKVIINDIKLPTTPQETKALMLDLDGSGKPAANRLGSTLQLIASMGGGKIDLQGEISKALRTGTVIFIGNLRATALDKASNAGLWLFLGQNPNPAPCTNPADLNTCGKHLVANATFGVAPTNGPYSLLKGKIQNGVFTGGPGNVTLLLRLSDTGNPVEVPLRGVRVKATVSANGLTDAILAGAVFKDDMTGRVLPGVHGLLTAVVARDCSAADGFAKPPNMCCKPGSTGETLVNSLFLMNPDDRIKYNCQIPLEVFINNPFVGTLLAPDVRLFDSAGNFKPQSGPNVEKDSVSLGLGISALRLGDGAFTLPPEAEAQAR